MGLIIRGCIWDIPILIFYYVLFWGPITPGIQQVPGHRVLGFRPFLFRGVGEEAEEVRQKSPTGT